MIICDRKYLKGSFYSGVPKMILETLNQSTAKRDRTEESNTFYNRKLFLLAAGCIIYKLIWEF